MLPVAETIQPQPKNEYKKNDNDGVTIDVTIPPRDIMREQATSQDAHKKGLQRQIRQTSDSLRDTVEQIQDTAEQKYQAVKKTVSDVLDYREEFQKEPVVWTVGALSAGFAAGYTVGYSHKLAKN